MSNAPLELRTFEAELPGMLGAHKGQFVVIKGKELCDYFDTYEQALSWAYQTFGLDRFFVKQVAPAPESIAHFTRDFGPCRQ